MAELLLIESIIMGVLIGLLELIFVHNDEKGLGWVSHGLHALPFAFLFTLISMNLAWAASQVNIVLGESLMIAIGLRVVIAIIATIKIQSAAAIISGKNAVGEKISHALIIGVLIAASPYIWSFIDPFIPL